MPRYRITQRSTNQVLLETDDLFAGTRALSEAQASGVDWDDLDMIDAGRGTSMLQRAHESGVRSLMAESRGIPYQSFKTLVDAQAAPVAAVILEGDDGGQIMVTCPAKLVRCSEARLRGLAEELQILMWNGDPDMAHVVYEPLAAGSTVGGGMGGGRITDGIWLHIEIQKLGLRASIEAVIAGRTDKLSSPRSVTAYDA